LTLPPDANCLLSVMDHCLRSRHHVNVVVPGKHPAPQWLAMDAAVKHCAAGVGIWGWAGNESVPGVRGVAEGDPDVVMACCGDVPTLETLAALRILREELTALRMRVVNIVDLMRLQTPTEHPRGLADAAFDALFTRDKPVISAFHAYPWWSPRFWHGMPLGVWLGLMGENGARVHPSKLGLVATISAAAAFNSERCSWAALASTASTRRASPLASAFRALSPPVATVTSSSAGPSP
jgi:hypothetical protein